MPEVTETQLPGVGVRHEFSAASGDRVAVLSHRGGRREILVYDRDDPDKCSTVIHLSRDETATLSELLGSSQVSQSLTAMEQQIEGLAIDWVTVPPKSSLVGSTIGGSGVRGKTGASIVALVRGEKTIAAPGPDEELAAQDIAVVVGTPEGLAELRGLLGA